MIENPPILKLTLGGGSANGRGWQTLEVTIEPKDHNNESVDMASDNESVHIPAIPPIKESGQSKDCFCVFIEEM